jgi:CRAL/TRIO domain
LSKRALTIVKEQAAIDSLCFPETMSKMLIVNAPTFFAATWTIIKGWLDPRTASKIEVFSNKAKMEARLLEYVDADQLPSDYGGTGADTNVTMMETLTGDFKRLSSKMFYIR